MNVMNCAFDSQLIELNENEDDFSTASSAIELEASTVEAPLWSIDDDTLFHPLGLMNHGTGTKTVFVTWSEDYLLNFVFKTSTKTQRTQTKLTKARVAMPSFSTDDSAMATEKEDEVIVDILILEFNTFLLMQSGRIYYFSSVKSMHVIPWLSGVRCFAASKQGFSLIRVMPKDNTLSLEVYRDMVNLGRQSAEQTLLQRFDITYDDRNIFNCRWCDDRFTLLPQTVSDSSKHHDFITALIGKGCTLREQQELHIFTVSGNVFALIASEDNIDTVTPAYHIELLCSYATSVELIRLHSELRLYLVFLQCGSIDIWYMSSRARGLQRKMHHTGAVFTCYDYVASSTAAFFYYTDSTKVAQLIFRYETATDACSVAESYKAVPGIVACTWVQSLQQLVCLSCNNIFYKLSFENLGESASTNAATRCEFENLSDLYELTPAKVRSLRAKANIVEQLISLPTELHQEIEAQFLQRQLIAIAEKKSLYGRKLCEAHVVFELHMPPMHNDLLLLYPSIIETRDQEFPNGSEALVDHLFALIFLKVAKNDIFQICGEAKSMWHIHISYTGRTHVICLPSNLLQSQQLCIVLPLQRRSQKMLPEFVLQLVTFVRNTASDFVAISLPIQVQKYEQSFRNLFAVSRRSWRVHATYTLSDFAAHFNSRTLSSTKEQPFSFIHTLQLPKTCEFRTILTLFQVSSAIDGQHFEVFFLETHCLTIEFVEAHHGLKLECSDAAALSYAKLYLNINLKLDTDKSHFDALQQLLLHNQCNIERGYGLLQPTEMDMDAMTVPNGNAHMAQLLKVYKKNRSEFRPFPS